MADNKTQIEKTAFTTKQTELKWFTEVNSYLFGKNTPGSEQSLYTWYKNLNPSYISEYRHYNLSNELVKTQPGSFRINDIWLTIPPESISINIVNNTIDIPVLRSKSSIKADTGQGEVQVNIRVVFADNPLLGLTLDEEIRYKLIPLLVQLQTMPFCQVENEYLRSKILDTIVKQNNTIVKDAGEIDMSILMLTYQNYHIATNTDSARYITVDFSFLMFNYLPFMNELLYPVFYAPETDGTPLRIQDKLLPVGTTLYPEISLPFYQFYAKQFMEREDYGRNYVHTEDAGKIMELHFYEYSVVPSYLLSPDQLKQVHTLGTETGFLSEDRGNQSIDVTGHYNSDMIARTMSWEGKLANKNTPQATMYGVQWDKNINDLPGYITSYRDMDKLKKSDAISILNNKYKNPLGLSNIPDTNLQAQIFDINVNGGLLVLLQKTMKQVNIPYNKADSLRDLICKIGKSGVDLVDFNNRLVSNRLHRYAGLSSYSENGTGWVIRAKSYHSSVPSTIPTYTAAPKKALLDATKQVQTNNTTTNNDIPFTQSYTSTPTPTTPQEKQLIDYINNILKVPGVEMVQTADTSKLTYIRVPEKIDIKRYSGLELISIEAVGGHDVVRLPITGYRYAAHQYMGGQVNKLMLHFIVYDSDGDNELKNILSVFNHVADNALNFRTFASFDGVMIKNNFINCVQGGNTFVFDNVGIETHPDIPGGSIVTISLTDFTGARKQASKAFEFETVAPDFSVDAYYSTIYKELFSKTGGLKVASYDDSNNLSNVKNYAKAGLEALGFKSISDALGMNNTTYVSFQIPNKGSQNQPLYSLLADLEDQLNKAKLLVSKSYTDPYGIFKQINTSGDLSLILKNSTFGHNGTNPNLYDTLRKWIQKNSGALVKIQTQNGPLLPETNSKYTDDVKSSIGQITQPAYPDFDLPPTIDPDFYFYQSDKYYKYADAKIDKFKQGALARVEDRYNKYTTKLTPLQKGDSIPMVYEMEQDLLTDDAKSKGYSKSFKMKDPLFDTVNNSDEYLYPSGGQTTNATSNNMSMTKDPVTGKFSMSLERNKNFDSNTITSENTIFYRADKDYTNALTNRRLSDAYTGLNIMYCFPTYKVYIIEEDDTEFLSPFRQDLNDMFGLNAIQEIRVVQHADQPADLMTLSFVDMTGKFTSARYKEYADMEKPKNPDTIDTKTENPFDGMILKDGTRIQLRAGYTNNINNLPIVFNGEIVSVEGDNGQYHLICQAFGVELVHDTKNPGGPENIATFNADTKDILEWCINQPEVRHFGRWKFKDNSNYQFSEDAYGVNFLNYKRIMADGRTANVWEWNKNDGEMNINAPEENAVFDFGPAIERINTSTLGWFNLWQDVKELASGWWKRYFVYNKTIWEIVDEMTYRYPGYVAKVLPFDDRATLFYGDPNSPYFYRSYTIAETESIGTYQDKLTQLTKDFEFNKQMVYDYEHPNSLNPINQIYRQFTTQSAYQRYKKWIEYEEKQLAQPKSGSTEDLISMLRRNTTDTFRKYYVVSSSSNLLKNKIKADYRDVYTEVQIGYLKDASTVNEIASKKPMTDLLTEKMNDFLEEEDIRSKYLEFPNVNTDSEAYKYAASQLWRESKKLYKGELITIGDPRYKPFDHIILFDDSTQTYGPVEINQHVLSIVPGEGMISVIEPSMVSTIRNIVSMSVGDAIAYMAAGKEGIDKIEASDNFFTKYFLSEQGSAQLSQDLTPFGVGVTGIGAIAAASGVATVSLPTLLVGATLGLMCMNIAIKNAYAAQNRNPIILHPLIRQGVPYLYGMNTYKQDSLRVWYQDQWKTFKTGTEDVAGYVSEAWQLLF